MKLIVSHAEKLQNWKNHSAIFSKTVENFKVHNADMITICHFFNKWLKSELVFYKNWQIVEEKKIGYGFKNSIFKYVQDIFLNFYYGLKFSKQSNWNMLYLWINPLNAFSWTFLWKIWKTQEIVFYTADYSPKRFKNKVLNKIYHWIDRFCVKNATETWNISSRIQKIREDFWYWNKNIFFPNYPGCILDSNINKNRTNNFELITSWSLDIQLDYKNLFLAISELREEFPQVKLKIAWDWPLKHEIIKEIDRLGLGKYIEILGFLDFDEYLNYVKKSGIGIALYTGKWDFNYYGDSTKCREYMFFWLPVLTTSFHSTADDIVLNNTWIVLKDSYGSSEIVNSLKYIFKNYDYFSDNAYRLAIKQNQILINKFKELWKKF